MDFLHTARMKTNTGKGAQAVPEAMDGGMHGAWNHEYMDRWVMDAWMDT